MREYKVMKLDGMIKGEPDGWINGQPYAVSLATSREAEFSHGTTVKAASKRDAILRLTLKQNQSR